MQHPMPVGCYGRLRRKALCWGRCGLHRRCAVPFWTLLYAHLVWEGLLLLSSIVATAQGLERLTEPVPWVTVLHFCTVAVQPRFILPNRSCSRPALCAPLRAPERRMTALSSIRGAAGPAAGREVQACVWQDTLRAPVTCPCLFVPCCLFLHSIATLLASDTAMGLFALVSVIDQITLKRCDLRRTSLFLLVSSHSHLLHHEVCMQGEKKWQNRGVCAYMMWDAGARFWKCSPPTVVQPLSQHALSVHAKDHACLFAHSGAKGESTSARGACVLRSLQSACLAPLIDYTGSNTHHQPVEPSTSRLHAVSKSWLQRVNN